MKFDFEMTQQQVSEFFNKYVGKTSRRMLIMAIIMTVLTAMLAILTVFFTTEYLLLFVGFFTVFYWIIYAAVKRGPKTQSPLYFKENAVDGIIGYTYELCPTDFVVSNPKKGNVNHYSYDIINSVMDLDGYVAVIMSNRQCLPILSTPETSQLISTLKSCAKVKK